MKHSIVPTPFSIAKPIQKKLGGSYYVVPRPDHPLLLSGPDILIGGNGRLTAVFLIPRSVRDRHLRARLTAARLALPIDSRLVAICDTGTCPSNSRLFENFDEILTSQSPVDDIAAYSTSDARSIVNKKSLFEMKKRHAIQFMTALQIATFRQRHKLESQSADELMIDLDTRNNSSISRDRHKRKGPSEISINGSTVSSLPKGNNMLSHLRYAWCSGMVQKFELDTGVPYADTNSQPSILLSEEWPSVKNDPEKPSRASAFSGWILAQSSTSKDIEELIERAQFVTRRRVYEQA